VNHQHLKRKKKEKKEKKGKAIVEWLAICGPIADVGPPAMPPKVRGLGGVWCGGEGIL
jgi:hypothetical protein